MQDQGKRRVNARSAVRPAATLASSVPAGYAQRTATHSKVATALIRRLFWPGLSAALMFLVLIGLGTWQIHRLHWKLGILAEIARAEAAPPVPLVGRPSPFTKVAATGRLRPDLAAWYSVEVRDTRRGQQMGRFLIEPLERPHQPPLLVDLGWVPQHPAKPIDQPKGTVTVTGYVRAASHPTFLSATDDPAKRHFYTLDPKRIAAALGLPRVAPFILMAMGPQPPQLWPDPVRHLPRPPNNHLQYALTWYGLAGVLVIEFIFWSRKRLRE